MTKRLLNNQGGEDSYPDGTNRQMAFTKKLFSVSGYIPGTNSTFAGDIWKPGTSRFLITKIIFRLLNANTISNVNGNAAPISADISLYTVTSGTSTPRTRLWGIQILTGDWVAKGGNTGYNWTSSAGNGIAINGQGTRMWGGSGGSGNPINVDLGNQFGAHGSTNPDIGYYFELPYTSFSNLNDSLGVFSEAASLDTADQIAMNCAVDICGFMLTI